MGTIVRDGAVVVGGEPVSADVNLTERFDGGAWQPLQEREVVAFLQAGAQ